MTPSRLSSTSSPASPPTTHTGEGGARRTHGPARLILALAAAALLLPSISLASMIALGLLLKRLGRERSQDA
jgi:hypothetical protein